MQNNNSALYAWSLNEAKRSYDAGASYYDVLRQRYMKTMHLLEDQKENEAYKEFADIINDKMNKEVENFSFNKEQQEKILSRIDAYVKHNILSNSELVTKISQSTGKTAKTDKNYLSNYSKRVKKIFESYQIWKNVEAHVSRIYNNILHRDVNATIDQSVQDVLYGYLRKTTINQITNNKFNDQLKNSLSGYTNVFLGDFKEDIATNAINAVLPDSAIRSGSERTKNSSKQTEMDIILGENVAKITNNELQNIIDNLSTENKKHITKTLEFDNFSSTGTQFFSAQVKSWSMPEISKPTSENRFLREVGSRKDIYDQYQFGADENQPRFTRGWHYSARVLGREIIRALGKSNVMYFANNKFYWTSDMIRKFKNASYFLTFYYVRRTNQQTRDYEFNYPAGKPFPGTTTTAKPGDIAWQRQMQKNIYKLKRK